MQLKRIESDVTSSIQARSGFTIIASDLPMGLAIFESPELLIQEFESLISKQPEPERQDLLRRFRKPTVEDKAFFAHEVYETWSNARNRTADWDTWMRRESKKSLATADRSFPVSRLLLTFNQSLPEMQLHYEATQNAFVAALAVARYQSRNSRLPQSLDALVPEYLVQVPKDPIDGKPIRYKKDGELSCRLYSIGLDRQDNGGESDGRSPDIALKMQVKAR